MFHYYNWDEIAVNWEAVNSNWEIVEFLTNFYYYNWEEVAINWEAVNMNWEEVGFLISEVLPFAAIAPLSGGGKPQHDLFKLNKLPEEKRRKIIKLVCKIKGEEDEYIDYKYKNDKDIIITAEHVDIIVEKLLKNKVKVDVQVIS